LHFVVDGDIVLAQTGPCHPVSIDVEIPALKSSTCASAQMIVRIIAYHQLTIEKILSFIIGLLNPFAVFILVVIIVGAISKVFPIVKQAVICARACATAIPNSCKLSAKINSDFFTGISFFVGYHISIYGEYWHSIANSRIVD
jgi:hypothetical protein